MITFSRLRKSLPALAGLVLLAACTTPDPAPRYAEITFASQPKIALSVSEIAAEATYREPQTDPNVEHRAPVSFRGEAMEWAAERLLASGGVFTATLVVEEASIVLEDLATDEGLSGAFKTEQAERYTASIRARLVIRDRSGAQRGLASAFAQRSSTLPEDRTLLDQERLLYTLIADTLSDLDTQMEQAINDNLGAFLVR